MILFVFEGGKAEPLVFDSLAKIFLTGENVRVVTCEHDLPTLFSQIFLFFDYDFLNGIGVKKVNEILKEMLEYFDDETENGKLYVNYPMVESLKYTKEMPDEKYHEYVVSRAVCAEHKFKGLAEAFAFAGAKQYRFIDLAKTPADEVRQNWELLKEQNVRKANHICNGENVLPEKKEDIAQDKLFEAQKAKNVDMNDSVAILNSFPIFLFEYLR